MVNTSTGPKPSPPQRIYFSQSSSVSPKVKRLQQQYSDKYGVVTYNESGEVSTRPTGNTKLKQDVNKRIVQEQQRANQANVAQSIKVASLNPAVRANIKKQGVTGNVGTVNVQTPYQNFGQQTSNRQIRSQLQQLKQSKIQEPRFTFGGQNKYAGQSDEAIRARLNEVPPPTRAERGLQPVQYRTEAVPKNYSAQQQTQARQIESNFVGPQQPTVSPSNAKKPLYVFGEDRVKGSKQPQKFRTVNFYGDKMFVRDDPAVLISLGFGRELANFGATVGNYFTGVSERLSGKEPSKPIPLASTEQGGVTGTVIGSVVEGGKRVFTEPKIQSGPLKGLPSGQGFIEEVGKGINKAQQQFIEEPYLSTGSLLEFGSLFAVGGPSKTSLSLTGKAGKGAGKTTTKAAESLDPSLRNIRKSQIEFQAGEPTGLGPIIEQGKLTGKTTGKTPLRKEGGNIPFKEGTGKTPQAVYRSATEGIQPSIKPNALNILQGKISKSFSGQTTKQTVRQATPKVVQVDRPPTLSFRQFQQRVDKLARGTTKTKKSQKGSNTQLYGFVATGASSTVPLITTIQPIQTEKQRQRQQQRFTFAGDYPYNPRPTRNIPTLQSRQIYDFIPAQKTVQRYGGGIFLPPALRLFGGGGSANQPYKSTYDRKFFRVFDIAKKPFGDIKYYVGYQQQSFKPIKEISRRRRGRIATKRPKNIIFDDSFSNLYRL